MSKLEIIYMFDDERTNLEAPDRGYRSHIFVEIELSIYKVIFFDIVRLYQEYTSEIDNSGFYSIDQNVILVKEVTKKEITNTVLGLYKDGYFDLIKSCDQVEFYELLNKEGNEVTVEEHFV